MSKYLQKVERDAHALPPPPAVCTVTGCQNATAVVVAMASPPESPRLRGWSWDRIAQRDNHGNATGRIQTGYSFSHWISRCPACYERDAHRAKKAQLPLAKPTVSETEAKAYLAHMRRSIR